MLKKLLKMVSPEEGRIYVFLNIPCYIMCLCSCLPGEFLFYLLNSLDVILSVESSLTSAHFLLGRMAIFFIITKIKCSHVVGHHLCHIHHFISSVLVYSLAHSRYSIKIVTIYWEAGNDWYTSMKSLKCFVKEFELYSKGNYISDVMRCVF